MPRAKLMHFEDGAPLTVSAVASLLGVSASTLRTWERRYGLGADERASGSHRRYSAKAVARLQKMTLLVRNGTPPREAAERVLETDLADVIVGEEIKLEPEKLLEALSTDNTATMRILEFGIARDGLLKTWTNMIEPTFEVLYDNECGAQAGECRVLRLTTCVYTLLKELNEIIPNVETPPTVPVTIAVCNNQTLVGQVVATALNSNGVSTRVLSTRYARGRTGAERFDEHMKSFAPRIVIMVGFTENDRELLGHLCQVEDIHVIVVSGEVLWVAEPSVERVRTILACAEEALDLARSLAA